MSEDDKKHFGQKPIRSAEFITPPNIVKAKVGSGGLNDQIIARAQSVLEEHSEDFEPHALSYLGMMQKGIDEIKANGKDTNAEQDIAKILIPCVQLKANGSMFHYPLVTRVADLFVQFMEVVERLDTETLDIAVAFHDTLKVIIASKLKSDNSNTALALIAELNNACNRYFEKHKGTDF